MALLNIGKVAKQAEMTVETIRFYEKQGLITPPERNASGYRQYPEETVKRLKFIRHAKEVGFTLNEIAELLALRRSKGASCADIKVRTAEKIELVDEKIRDLKRIRTALISLMMKCTGKGPVSECPILEELELDE